MTFLNSTNDLDALIIHFLCFFLGVNIDHSTVISLVLLHCNYFYSLF
jgi:hypothetical protein